jgi:Protein of unknown function (DUF1553)/Protein of unknown function (DUF1549)
VLDLAIVLKTSDLAFGVEGLSMDTWRTRRDRDFFRPVLIGCGLFLATGLGSARTAVAGDGSPGSGRKDAVVRPVLIDKYIEEAWKKAGVKPANIASEPEFLRRAYLDLLGRIPTVREARAYLATRESDKRGKLITYLLDHADYPKNFATIWSILLIGRGNQGQMVDRAALSGWLRKQFADDRPWNEVVRELVSSTGSNKENGAVNYVLAHLEFDAVPLTSRTTRLFLGEQIQCTQCHDHPSNDWKQIDFWGINAFFKGMKAENVRKPDATGLDAYDHTELRDEPTDTYVRFDRRNGLVGVAFPRFLDGRKISQGNDVIRRTELGKLMADPNNEALSKAFVNRMWAHFVGRGFVNPVDDFGSHNPPSHPELLDHLAKEFKESGYNVRKLCQWIMSSRAYQLSSVPTKAGAKDEGLFSQMQLKPMTPEQLFDSLLTATNAQRAGSGDENHRKRDAWLRQFLFTFANDETEESTNFQGTIPQALMMMNGELMNEALSGKPGSFLCEVVEQGSQQASPAGFMVSSIYLAALSRVPTKHEISQAQQYFASYPDSLQVLQDLFWALLNSNEFVLIH